MPAHSQDEGEDVPCVTGEQAFPLPRSGAFGWDGPVMPSSADDPVALMTEFPQIPSAEDFVHPEGSRQIAFFKAIRAVTLRAAQLNAGRGEAEASLWRDQVNQGLKEAFGLTDAEVALLGRDDLPEAEQHLLQEKMAATLLGGMDADAMQQGAQARIVPVMERQARLKKYEEEVLSCYPAVPSDADYAFPDAERKALLEIKRKIYATENPSVYNPLYARAWERIAAYRTRAAESWVRDVQKRFDAQREALPKLVEVNRRAVAEGVLPECALWREPLNLVIAAGDILSEAYSDFPSEYPPMYQAEVVFECSLAGVPGGEGASPWWPEGCVSDASAYDDLVAGKRVFATGADGNLYQLSGNRWVALSDARRKQLSERGAHDAAQGDACQWTSQDGKRTVWYNAEGGFIQLPEGDMVFPNAWKKEGGKLRWAYLVQEEVGDGETLCSVVQCTYKL